MIVFAVGDEYMVKLYSSLFPDDIRIETASLLHIAGRIGVKTPEVVATGELVRVEMRICTGVLFARLATLKTI